MLKLLTAFDALRRPERLEPALKACEADARGRLGYAEVPYSQVEYLRAAQRAAAAIRADAFVAEGLTGPAIGVAMRKARVAAIADAMGPLKA